jgi:hypothetical protein
MRIYYTTLIIFLNFFLWCAYTQSPIIQWQKSFGGSGIDEAHSIKQTNDGGYIVCGETNSNDGDVIGNHGQTDVWVIKLNELGEIQWKRCYGGQGPIPNAVSPGTDIGYSICQTSDSCFIIAGITNSNNFDISDVTCGNNINLNYILLLKINFQGDILWQKCLDGIIANSVEPTYDGGCIVAASGRGPSFDYLVFKLDINGEEVWQWTSGGIGSDKPKSVTKTLDGGFLISGIHSSEDLGLIGDLHDSWIVKLNALGELQWQKSIGDLFEDQIYSAVELNNGNIIFCGWSNSNVTDHKGLSDLWVVCLSSTGDINWQKRYGGESQDMGFSICLTLDGGIILAGTTASNNIDVNGNHGNYDFWILKIDILGNIEWQKCLGGTNKDIASSIEQSNDGGIIIAGMTESNNLDVTNNNGQSDFWVVKLSSILNNNQTEKILPIDISPNPTSHSITIKGEKNMNQSFSIFDQMGREVLKGKLNGISTEVNLSILSKGIYTLKIDGNYKPAQIVKE